MNWPAIKFLVVLPKLDRLYVCGQTNVNRNRFVSSVLRNNLTYFQNWKRNENKNEKQSNFVSLCSSTECKQTKLGSEYQGTRSTTTSGKTCQRWDQQTPHIPYTVNAFPNPSEEENYCRNPDGESEGPWCYTVDPATRWDYCGIPYCSGM